MACSHPPYLTFTLQTYYHPEHRFRSCLTQMTSPSYLHIQARANTFIQPYLYKVFAWKKHNNLTLNPDKTTCTLFTPDPAEYKSNMDLRHTTHTCNSSMPHNSNRKHNIHPLYKHTTYFKYIRLNTIFYNARHTTNIPTDTHTVTTIDIQQICAIYTHLLSLCN